jgi:hypothetical protein
MRKLLLAATAVTALAFALPANAALVLTFGQNGSGNTITGTATGGTSTTITGTDVSVDVTQILGGSPSTPDFLTLNAISDGAAFLVGTVNVAQHFDGTFSIRTAAGGGGTNLLSGAFTDLLLGTGPSATITVGAPPDLASFTSDVIDLGSLGPPVAVSFSFANVTPPVGLDGNTLASFTSGVSGLFSAEPIPTPEPAGLALFGLGLLGLGFVRRQSRRV